MFCPFSRKKCKESDCRLFYAGDCVCNIAVGQLKRLVYLEELKMRKVLENEQQTEGKRRGA